MKPKQLPQFHASTYVNRALTTVCFVLTYALSIAADARDLSRDEVFVVASKNLLSGGVSSLGSPSVNDSGDIVARITTAAGTEHRVFLFSAQTNNPPPGNTASIIARAHANTLGSLPLINNNKSVVSALSFTGGNQNIVRLDFDPQTSTYSSTAIARGNVGQTQPFSFLSPIAGIDNAIPANVYFYGERTPLSGPQNHRIYRSNHEVTTPATETPIASYPDVYSTLDAYVASSSNMKLVYRGTKSGDLGLYRDDGNLTVATASTGFSSTGVRSTINSLDAVAFYGVYNNVVPQLTGIFLWLQGEASPRYAGNLAQRVTGAEILTPSGFVPSGFSAGDRIALNDLNQVGFLGNDGPAQAIFTTTLGRTRKVVSVGDRILAPNNTWVSITSLFLYQGIGQKGQLTFLANTSDGDQMILVANRAYNQRSTLYSPVSPSYRGIQYLLRSVSGSGFPSDPHKTIGYVGCNLTSTVNLLNSYGATTSPLEFQNWLLSNKSLFINSKNDFEEAAVEWFSLYLFGQGKTTTRVAFRGYYSNANGPNLRKIQSELRAGRPVKIRVPSSERYGHYILAYGLVDPSKPDAQLTAADVLIADPGKSPDFTLADYGQLQSPQQPGQTYDQVWGANWIEDQGAGDNQRRVHLYDKLPQPTMIVSAHSPVQILLTDSQGRRVGSTTATGTLREVPGGDYYEEISYQTLDDAGETPEPAWGTTEPVKHVIINGATTGAFTLNVYGTGTGSYTISILGNGGVTPDTTFISGTITPGGTRTIGLSVTSTQPRFLDPSILSDGSINWTVVGDPAKQISIETSTNLTAWTPFSGAPITNGVGTVNVSTTDGTPCRFLRAISN